MTKCESPFCIWNRLASQHSDRFAATVPLAFAGDHVYSRWCGPVDAALGLRLAVRLEQARRADWKTISSLGGNRWPVGLYRSLPNVTLVAASK